MRLLAIDTALDACQTAVVEDGLTLAKRSETMTRGHQERLAPSVSEVMAQAGIGFDTLDRVAVTVGPGSFTGLRVGLAFAKGLMLALQLPCVGVGTLEALAASADAFRTAAVIDARRERCYMQLFEGGRAAGPPQLFGLEDARERLADFARGGPVRVVGPGAPLLGRDADIAVPDLAAIARLGQAAAATRAAPAPLYLRGADALTIAERAQRR